MYEGYAIPHATNTAELAGHELSTCLSRMLRDRGVGMETLAELDVVQDIKEKLCYVVVDYDSERKAYNTGERNDTTYTVSIYTARVAGLLPGSHQGDVRMRSRRLLWLDDNKSAACCQQA